MDGPSARSWEVRLPLAPRRDPAPHLSKFASFPQLPTELRLMIWRLFLQDDEREVVFDHDDRRILPTPQLISPLLSVNVETRKLALEFYNEEVEIFDMPDTSVLVSKGFGYKKVTNAAMIMLGRPAGCVRLNLGKDRFIVGAEHDWIDLCARMISRSAWVALLRYPYSDRVPRRFDTAVSARIHQSKLSLIRDSITLYYEDSLHSEAWCRNNRLLLFHHLAGC